MHYPAKWSGGFQSWRFFPRAISFFQNLTSAAFECPAAVKCCQRLRSMAQVSQLARQQWSCTPCAWHGQPCPGAAARPWSPVQPYPGAASWPWSPAPASGLSPARAALRIHLAQPRWHIWGSRSCPALLQLQLFLPWQIQGTSVTHFHPASELQKMLNHQHSEENTHFFCKQNICFMVFLYQLFSFFFLMV